MSWRWGVGLVLLLGSAPLAAQAPPAEPPAEPPALADPLAAIDAAIRLRQEGDLATATRMLDEMELLVPASAWNWYLYQRGICAELSGDLTGAQNYYETVIANGAEHVADARFRLALVWEAQGKDEQALEQVLALAKSKGLDEADQITVALQYGISLVNSGKTRKGVRRIEKALAQVEGGDTHRYLRAKARYTLATVLIEQVADQDLSGSEKQAVRDLQARSLAIQAAEQQVLAVIALQEVEWILAGLILMGDAYQALAGDLAQRQPDPSWSEALAAEFRAEVSRRVNNGYTKAYAAYDEGISLATRLGYESPRLAVLRARRAGLEGIR